MTHKVAAKLQNPKIRIDSEQDFIITVHGCSSCKSKKRWKKQ